MLEAFADLSTPLVADACLRCGVPLRAAHSGIRPVVAGQEIAGRVLPVRHYGSVDVFLEAFGRAQAGDVLVIDNGGRSDEACVGDLAVLEAEAAGVAALVVWGLHRDTPELAAIGLPVFSYGSVLPELPAHTASYHLSSYLEADLRPIRRDWVGRSSLQVAGSRSSSRKHPATRRSHRAGADVRYAVEDVSAEAACENVHNALPRKRHARGCKYRHKHLALCLRHERTRCYVSGLLCVDGTISRCLCLRFVS